MKTHIQVEYDVNYTGGDYSKVGSFVLIPTDLADLLGVEEAFRVRTGLDQCHIIHYSEDELYDENGEHVEDAEDDDEIENDERLK